MKLIASIIALASANYNAHTLPQDVSEFTWADEANRDLFLAQEYVKEYVRYQAPDDEYVPIEDLPIVCKYSKTLCELKFCEKAARGFRI